MLIRTIEYDIDLHEYLNLVSRKKTKTIVELTKQILIEIVLKKNISAIELLENEEEKKDSKSGNKIFRKINVDIKH